MCAWQLFYQRKMYLQHICKMTYIPSKVNVKKSNISKYALCSFKYLKDYFRTHTKGSKVTKTLAIYGLTLYIILFLKHICACIYLYCRAIQLLIGDDWDHISQFNPTTRVCLSQTSTWISNTICRVFFILCITMLGERRFFVLLILVGLLTITIETFFL